MSRIVAVAPELPAYSYPQHEITAELVPLLTHGASHAAVMERTHANSGIGTRHTALPLERYRDLGTFRQTNDIFIDVATDLCSRALARGLAEAGLEASDVDFVIFTSVTGLSAPSIDALMVQRLGLRSDVKRLPSYGLGCMAGAAGISRLHDYMLGHPTGVAVLLSVELCSLTLQRGDESMANFVATGLFGDGAAAVVMVGEDHPKAAGPRVVDTRSATYPDTTDVIGFLVGETGFEIVLSPGVADVIEKHFPEDVAAFLSQHDLTVDAIDTWVAHPGGPKVLDAFASSLGLPPAELALSWASLERVGNLSSAAVLHVLADTIAAGNAGPTGLLFALGPGVSAEFVLLEWPA